ncbi:MAG: GNAT family N-acetyltransferase [Myxococcaceae bacterium]
MSPDDVILRPARLDDLSQLLEFEQGIIAAERPFDLTLKPGEIHYYDLAALIRSHDAHVVVGEHEGRLVASGFAEIRTAKPHLRHSRYAYLGFMYVAPELRGRGLNGRIVDALVEWARERDVTEVRLEVYAGNDSARRAYEKLGFTPNLVEMRLNTG